MWVKYCFCAEIKDGLEGREISVKFRVKFKGSAEKIYCGDGKFDQGVYA